MPLFPLESDRRQNTRSGDYDPEGFEAFWRDYPRREARKEAVKAWNQLRPPHAVQDSIHDALAWQCQLWKERRFTPLPASYLRGERWTDEPPKQEIPWHRLTPWEQAKRAGLK